MLALFVMWELRVGEPMLEMRFFRNPAFSTGTGGMILLFVALYGVMVVLQGTRVVLEKSAVRNPAHLALARLPSGHYRVEMVAVDAAGNRTPDPPSVPVTVP